MTYNIEYGDGDSSELAHPNVLSFQDPVIVSHRYSTANVWSVFVNATNAESFVQTQTQVRVIEPVRSLVLDVQEQSQSPNSTFSFGVVVDEASLVLEDMTCSFDFGDGTAESISAGYMTEADEVVTEHSYDLGVFDVSVVCTNGISSLRLNSTVTAEEPITGLSLESDRVNGRPGEFFHFTASSTAGSNMVLTIDYGNGQTEVRHLANNRRGGSVTSFSVKYSATGLYNVSLTTENLVSSTWAVLAKRIYVVNDVRDLAIAAPAIISFPPGLAQVTVQHQQLLSPPTDVTCDVSSPYLPDQTYFRDEISHENALDFALTFTESEAVGINSVVINCSNVLSYQVLQTDVLMEAMIEDVRVSVSDTYIMVKGAVDVNVTVGFGSHAQYVLDFGDGDVVVGVFTDIVLQEKQLTFWHAYAQADIYNVTFSVVNRVSAQVMKMFVGFHSSSQPQMMID